MIYVHFDIDNMIDEHILYQLRSYSEVGIEIIFVSNSKLNAEELAKLDGISCENILHHNKGFDFSAWKDVILSKNSEFFSLYDELIITNCTTYGPIVPIDLMFEAMAKVNCDYWGIYERTASHGLCAHLASYFIVFRPSLFSSHYFWDYWKSIKDEYSTMAEVIFDGEIRLSQYFRKHKFKYMAYSKVSDLRELLSIDHKETYSTSAADWVALKCNSPLIKVKAFQNLSDNSYAKTSDIFEVLNNLKSDYPQSLIINHQRRVSPLSWQRQLPNTYQITDLPLDCNYNSNFAILINIKNSEDLALFKNISNYDFAYLINIEDETLKLTPQNNRQIIKYSDNYLQSFCDELKSFDTLLIIDFYKNEKYPDIFSYKVNDFLLKSLLDSQEKIQYQLEQFEKDSELGIIIPDYPSIFFIAEAIVKFDAVTQKEIENFYNLKLIQETNFPTFFYGAIFCKTAAIKEFINDPKLEYIQYLPYIAQANKFYFQIKSTPNAVVNSLMQLQDFASCKHPKNFCYHFKSTIEIAGKNTLQLFHKIFLTLSSHLMKYEEPIKKQLKSIIRR